MGDYELAHVVTFERPSMLMMGQRRLQSHDPVNLAMIWIAVPYRLDGSPMSSRSMTGVVDPRLGMAHAGEESFSMTLSALDAASLCHASARRLTEFYLHVSAVDKTTGTVLTEGSRRIVLDGSSSPPSSSSSSSSSSQEGGTSFTVVSTQAPGTPVSVDVKSATWLLNGDGGIMDGHLDISVTYDVVLMQALTGNGAAAGTTVLPVDVHCAPQTANALAANGPWQAAVAADPRPQLFQNIKRAVRANGMDRVVTKEALGLSSLSLGAMMTSGVQAALGVSLQVEDGSLALAPHIVDQFSHKTLTLSVGGPTSAHPPVVLAEVAPGADVTLAGPQYLNDLPLSNVSITRSKQSAAGVVRGSLNLDIVLTTIMPIMSDDDEAEVDVPYAWPSTASSTSAMHPPTLLDGISPLVREVVLHGTVSLQDLPVAVVMGASDGLLYYRDIDAMHGYGGAVPLSHFIPFSRDDEESMDTALSFVKGNPAFTTRVSLFYKQTECAYMNVVVQCTSMTIGRGGSVGGIPRHLAPFGSMELAALNIHQLSRAAFEYFMKHRAQSLDSILGFNTNTDGKLGLEGFQHTFIKNLSLGSVPGVGSDDEEHAAFAQSTSGSTAAKPDPTRTIAMVEAFTDELVLQRGSESEVPNPKNDSLAVGLVSRTVVAFSVLGARSTGMRDFLALAGADTTPFSRAYRSLIGRDPSLKDSDKLSPDALDVHQVTTLVTVLMEALEILRTLRDHTVAGLSLMKGSRTTPATQADHVAAPPPPTRSRRNPSAAATSSSGQAGDDASALEALLRQQLTLEASLAACARVVILALLRLSGQLTGGLRGGRASTAEGAVRLAELSCVGASVYPLLTLTLTLTSGLALGLARRLTEALFMHTNDYAPSSAASSDAPPSTTALLEAQRAVSVLTLVMNESKVGQLPMRVSRYVDDRLRRPRPASVSASATEPHLRRTPGEPDSGLDLSMAAVASNRVTLLRDVCGCMHLCYGSDVDGTEAPPSLELPAMLQALTDALSMEDRLFWSGYGSVRIALAHAFMRTYPLLGPARNSRDPFVIFHRSIFESIGLGMGGDHAILGHGPSVEIEGRPYQVLGWHTGGVLLEEARFLMTSTLSTTLREARSSPLLSPVFSGAYTLGESDTKFDHDMYNHHYHAHVSVASIRSQRVSAQFGLGMSTATASAIGDSIATAHACDAFLNALIKLSESLVGAIGASKDYHSSVVQLNTLPGLSLRALVVAPSRSGQDFARRQHQHPPPPVASAEPVSGFSNMSPTPKNAARSVTGGNTRRLSLATSPIRKVGTRTDTQGMTSPVHHKHHHGSAPPPSVPMYRFVDPSTNTAFLKTTVPSSSAASGLAMSDAGLSSSHQTLPVPPPNTTAAYSRDGLSEAYYRSVQNPDNSEFWSQPVAAVAPSSFESATEGDAAPPAPLPTITASVHYATPSMCGVDARPNPHAKFSVIPTSLPLPMPMGISGLNVFTSCKPQAVAMLAALAAAVPDLRQSRIGGDGGFSTLSMQVADEVELAIGLVVDADCRIYGAVLREFDTLEGIKAGTCSCAVPTSVLRGIASNPTLYNFLKDARGNVCPTDLGSHNVSVEGDWAFFNSLPHVPPVLPLSTLSVLYMGATDHLHDAYRDVTTDHDQDIANTGPSCCGGHGFWDPFVTHTVAPTKARAGLNLGLHSIGFASYALPLLNLLAEDVTGLRSTLVQATVLAQASHAFLRNLHEVICSGAPLDVLVRSRLTALEKRFGRESGVHNIGAALNMATTNGGLVSELLRVAVLAILSFEAGRLLNLMQVLAKAFTFHAHALSSDSARVAGKLSNTQTAAFVYTQLLRAAFLNVQCTARVLAQLNEDTADEFRNFDEPGGLCVDVALIKCVAERALKLSALTAYTGMSQSHGTWPDAGHLLHMDVPQGLCLSSQNNVAAGPTVGEALVSEALAATANMPYVSFVRGSDAHGRWVGALVPAIELARQTLSSAALLAVELSSITDGADVRRSELGHVVSRFAMEGAVALAGEKFKASSTYTRTSATGELSDMLRGVLGMGTDDCVTVASSLDMARAMHCLMLALSEFEPCSQTIATPKHGGPGLPALARLLGRAAARDARVSKHGLSFSERVKDLNKLEYVETGMQRLTATLKNQLMALQALAACWENSMDAYKHLPAERAAQNCLLAASALMSIAHRVVLPGAHADVFDADVRQLKALNCVHELLCRAVYSSLTWQSHKHDVERMPVLHQVLMRDPASVPEGFSEPELARARFERDVAAHIAQYGGSFLAGLSTQRFLLYLASSEHQVPLVSTVFGTGLGLDDGCYHTGGQDLHPDTGGLALFLFREAFRNTILQGRFHSSLALIDVADPPPDCQDFLDGQPDDMGKSTKSALSAKLAELHSKSSSKSNRDKAELHRARDVVRARASAGSETAWYNTKKEDSLSFTLESRLDGDGASGSPVRSTGSGPQGGSADRAYTKGNLSPKKVVPSTSVGAEAPSSNSVTPDDVYYAVRFTDVPWALAKSSSGSEAAKIRLGFKSKFQHMLNSSKGADAGTDMGRGMAAQDKRRENPFFLDAMEALTYTRGNTMLLAYMNRFAADQIRSGSGGSGGGGDDENAPPSFVGASSIEAGPPVAGLMGFLEEDDDFWLIYKYDGESCVRGYEELDHAAKAHRGQMNSVDNTNHEAGAKVPLPLGSYQRFANTIQDAYPEFRVLPPQELYRPQTFRHSSGRQKEEDDDSGGASATYGNASKVVCPCCVGPNVHMKHDAFTHLQNGADPRRRERTMQIFPAFPVFEGTEPVHQDRSDSASPPNKFSIFVRPDQVSEKRRRLHVASLHADMFPNGAKVTDKLLSPQLLKLTLSLTAGDNTANEDTNASFDEIESSTGLSHSWTSNVGLVSIAEAEYVPWIQAHEEVSSLSLRGLRHSYRQLLYVNSLSGHELRGQTDVAVPVHHTALTFSALRFLCNASFSNVSLPVGRHLGAKLLAAERDRRTAVDSLKRKTAKRAVIREKTLQAQRDDAALDEELRAAMSDARAPVVPSLPVPDIMRHTTNGFNKSNSKAGRSADPAKRWEVQNRASVMLEGGGLEDPDSDAGDAIVQDMRSRESKPTETQTQASASNMSTNMMDMYRQAVSTDAVLDTGGEGAAYPITSLTTAWESEEDADVYQARHGMRSVAGADALGDRDRDNATGLYFDLLNEQLFCASSLAHASFDLLWIAVAVGRVKAIVLQHEYQPINSQSLVHDLTVDLSPEVVGAHGPGGGPDELPSLCLQHGYSSFLYRDVLVADRIADSDLSLEDEEITIMKRGGNKVDYARLAEDDLRLVFMQLLSWSEGHVLGGAL